MCDEIFGQNNARNVMKRNEMKTSHRADMKTSRVDMTTSRRADMNTSRADMTALRADMIQMSPHVRKLLEQYLKY